MITNKAIFTIAILSLSSAAALAQSDGTGNTPVQRNINQQQRIEQGLQSGELTTREAGRLEREQSAVERTESRALRDGSVSTEEQQRINQTQNRVSRSIYNQKHDDQLGNPDSRSSRRMQANVQRNVNQQQRIEQGLNSGELNNAEAAKLERGQAHINRVEARQASNGRVGAAEEGRMQRLENRSSRRIFRQKHD